MARVLKVSGDVKRVEPANGTDFSLEELKEFVDGYIEIIQLPNNEIMVINENGKVVDLPFNELATNIYQELIYKGDYIAGDALICDKEQVK